MLKNSQTLIFLTINPYNYETSEIWCFHIHDLFRKILEENSEIFSKNRYIRIYEKFYEGGKGLHPDRNLTNYIYYNICDFLIFISEKHISYSFFQKGYLKKYITRDTILNECAKRKEIL